MPTHDADNRANAQNRHAQPNIQISVRYCPSSLKNICISGKHGAMPTHFEITVLSTSISIDPDNNFIRLSMPICLDRNVQADGQLRHLSQLYLQFSLCACIRVRHQWFANSARSNRCISFSSFTNRCTLTSLT